MKPWRWIGLTALALVPYLGALHAPLLYDDRTLLDNRWLAREAGPVSVFRHHFFYGSRREASDLYRPLTALSLAWNLRATPSKEGIRAVNLALHALATLALAWMLAEIATRTGSPPRGVPWIGAAIFAVHPLGSEAVLWAVGRADVAAAALGAVAFVLYLRERLLPAAAAFLAALCFKESAAAWLAIGAAWTLLVPPRPPVRAALARAAVFGGAFAAYLLLRGSAVGWAAEPRPFVDNPLASADAATRVANAILLLARYAGKMIWPRTLSVEYGFDQIPVVPLVPWGALAALAIAAAAVGSVVALLRRGRRREAFLVAFVPCAFAVTGNVIAPIGTIFAERLAYLPLMGFCALAGLALASIPAPAWRGAALAAILVAGGSRTIARGRDYRDLAALSEATAAASPRAVKALYNAARTRMRLGRTPDAIPLLERAVAIWPEYARARELLEQARRGSDGGSIETEAP